MNTDFHTLFVSGRPSSLCQRHPRLRALLPAALAASFFLVRLHQRPQQQTHPLGKFTAAQILQQSAPICKAFLFGDSKKLLLSVVGWSLPSVKGMSSRPIWAVQCMDERDREIVNLRWYADTGELEAVGAPRTSSMLMLASIPKLHQLTREQARRYADGWRSALGLDCNASWRLNRLEHLKTSHTWTAQYVSRGRSIQLVLDGHSGRLFRAFTGMDASYPLSPQFSD